MSDKKQVCPKVCLDGYLTLGGLGYLARENVIRLGQLTIVLQRPCFIFTRTRPTVLEKSAYFKLDQL